MSTFVAIGDSVDRIVSWGALSTTTDAHFWTEKSNPFNQRGKCIGIACGTINSQTLYYIIGDAGLAASSTDCINWNVDKIYFGNFQPLSIVWDSASSAFYTCGQLKFFDDEGGFKINDEVAVVMKNSTGNHWDWEIVYTYNYSNSRFYGIRTTYNESGIIALGNENNTPITVMTLDAGTSWSTIDLPTNLNIKHAYDFCFNVTQGVVDFYISTDGYILQNTSPDTVNFNTTWTASRYFKPKYGKNDFRKIAVANSKLVAVCSGGIAYSNDLSTWKFLEQPGYSFRSIAWFNDRWIAGAESLLTQYTHWTSTDTDNWTPDNCGVQIFDSIII